MIISAGGNDFTIPGKNLKVSLSMELAKKDVSGMTSSSETVAAGNKPKIISCG